jgi:hypothetical protein
MENLTPAIRPVSNWALLVREYADAGVNTVGAFLVALAFQHVTPTPADMPVIFEAFREYREERQLMIRGRAYNVRVSDESA